jgi:hypothetical protein
MSIFPRRYSLLSSPLAAIVVLIAFWLGMLASLRDKSLTLDEGAHVSAGYTFWRYNDYRFNPENGNLPERVMALPLLFGHYKFPDPESDGEIWRNCRKWDLTWKWFYELDNDADAMTRRGRAASGLLAVALGILVWAWSRQLFGPIGGILSLLLYALNPSVLANGALMTSDAAGALFFFAATWAWWRVLQRLTAARVVLSGLAMGGLFLSKMSAPLIVPVALILVVARLIHGAPLPIQGLGLAELRHRGAQLVAFAVVAVAHVAIVLIMIWGFHGFRYAASAPALPHGAWVDDPWELVLDKPVPNAVFDRLHLGSIQREEVKQIFARDKTPQNNWTAASREAVEAVKREALTTEQAANLHQLLAEPSPRFAARVLETLRNYHLLPEAYIYGYAHVWRYSRQRAAFFNGDYGMYGWRTFFPYTFLVKTPITLFAVIAFAIAAAIARWRARPQRAVAQNFFRTVYDTLPLWILFVVYWAAAISSHINIGHRHILPTYPPLFVLCGASAWCLSAWVGRHNEPRAPYPALARAAGAGLCVAVILLAAESFYRFPHYLAYFNGVVKPEHAYRHLVDSSLDWGQDLPGVRRYIEARHPKNPIYLSYFGFASPAYYGVPAIHSYSSWGSHPPPPLQILALPDMQADEVLRDFLRRESEYDDEVVARSKQGDKAIAVVVKRPAALRLTGGTYFISATLLQTVTQPGLGAFGPWNARLETAYQTARQSVRPLLADDPAERSSALAQFPPEKWFDSLSSYEYLRFYRLAAFLRQREPDDNVGFSILIYRLSDDDLVRALDGPPAELGRDMFKALFETQP